MNEPRTPRTQPLFAPAVTATGLVMAITAGLLAAYAIADCWRFQTRAGQCDAQMRQHLPTVVAAAAAGATAWGGYNTLNPGLRAAKPPRKPGPPQGAYGTPLTASEPTRRRRVSTSKPSKD
jgi:hypothetical protein